MDIEFGEFENLPDIVKKEQEYKKVFPLLESTVIHLGTLFDEFNDEYKAKLGKDLFISRECRAKSWNSVCNKLWGILKDKKATQIERKDVETAYDSIHDLAGGRIEVNFFDDVQDRAGHLIRFFSSKRFKTDLAQEGIKDKKYLDDDYHGYRAYHLFVQGSTKDTQGKKKKVIFEVQIRSSFQHVWAKLMHPLVYSRFRGKGGGIPDDIIKEMISLSANIHAADSALMALRDRVKRYG